VISQQDEGIQIHFSNVFQKGRYERKNFTHSLLKYRCVYRKKKRREKTADTLPAPISIKEDFEFAFSNWIS
jgi:hypothetical protein